MKYLALLTFSFLSLQSFSPAFAQQDADLLYRYQFDKSNLVSPNAFKPLAGKLNASLTGPVKFSTDKPQSLLLTGNSKSKHGLLISNDPVDAKLPNTQITVEAWVRIDQHLKWGGIVSALQDNGDFERGWQLGFANWQFYFALSSKKRNRITYLKSPVTFEPGVWYHVAGTYDGREQRLYVDGKLAARSTAQSGPISYAPRLPFIIGAYKDDNEHYTMTGRIHQASIWKRALSPKDLSARFDSRKKLYPGIIARPPVVTDWPTYNRDNQRSGIATHKLQFPLKLKWQYQLRHASKPAWPPPAKQNFWGNKHNLRARVVYDRAAHVVAVGDRLYLASSADDQLRCLDLANGKEKWTFFTQGPIRLAPTVTGNRVIFGCDDGHVYCLDAATGKQKWRYRLGPTPRLIPGNERVISPWPIRTGVLVEGNKAFFCAGIFPQQGVYQAAVHIRTGKSVASGKVNISAQGYLERRDGKLYVPTGRDPAGAYVSQLQRRGKAIGKPVNRMTKDYPYAFIGSSNARIGGGDRKVAAFDVANGTKLWEAGINGKAYSLAIVKNNLLVSTDIGHVYCFSNDAGGKPIIYSASTPTAYPYANTSSQTATQQLAQRIVDTSKIRIGYGLVLGSGDGALLYELAHRTNLRLVGVESDPVKVAHSRQRLAAAGLYGRVVVHHADPAKPLPYTNYMFNLIVSGTATAKTHRPEILRMLRPAGGIAIFDLNNIKPHRRPALPGAGEWTHMYANPANTVCSNDTHVSGRLALQWFGPPGPRQMLDRHLRTVAPLYKNGIVFIPGNNRIYAVDAYNGTVLWNMALADSRRVAAFRDSSYLAATKQYLYTAAADQCYGVNVQNGSREITFDLPSTGDNIKRDWGHVAAVGSTLYGSAVKHGASRREVSRRIIKETYYDFGSAVCSDYLFAYDRTDGTKRWVYNQNKGLIVNSTITIANDRIYFIQSDNPATLKNKDGRASMKQLTEKGAHLVAINAKTGKLIYQKPVDLSAIQHSLYLAYAQGKLVLVGSRNAGKNKKTDRVWYDIHTHDAKTGKRVWFHSQNQGTAISGDHGEQDHHPVIVKDKLYCEPFAYDLHTGKPDKSFKWIAKHRRGCGNIAASANTFFFRQNTAAMFSLSSNKYQPVTSITRPGCWINMLPVGGLLLIPEASSGCTCNYAIQSSLAFIPVSRLKPPPQKP